MELLLLLLLELMLGLLPSIHGCSFQPGKALNLRGLRFSTEPVQVLSWFLLFAETLPDSPWLVCGI